MNSLLKTKVKRISADMLINLVGSGLSLLTLHLAIYPNVAKMVNSEIYGEMQTIMSLIFLVSGTLGSTLSTVRLLRDFDYKENNFNGDFNKILSVCLLINFILLLLLLILPFKQTGLLNIVLLVIIAFFNLTAEYFNVGLRLKLDFNRVFLNQFVGCIGYFLGYLLFIVSAYWQFIFLVAYFGRTIYCICNTDLLHEAFVSTAMMKQTVSDYLHLGIAELLGKALGYFDKILLFPLLGGTMVSIYYVANIFGKIIIQTLAPITSVILSYLSKQKKVSSGVLKVVIPLSLAFCTMLYFVCIYVSKPVITFFYPQWASQAIPYVPIATLSLCVSAFISILYPFTLKMFETEKQIIINGLSLIIYIIIVLLFIKEKGLLGCFYALLVSYFLKLLLIYVMTLRNFNTND